MAKKNDIVRDVVALAGEFVIKRKGDWDHEAWEGFVKKAGKAGADTSDSGLVRLGKLLETVKKLYVSLQEPAPVKAEKKPKAEKPAKVEKAVKAEKPAKVKKADKEVPGIEKAVAKPAKKKVAAPANGG
jgi:hypothetical protein